MAKLNINKTESRPIKYLLFHFSHIQRTPQLDNTVKGIIDTKFLIKFSSPSVSEDIKGATRIQNTKNTVDFSFICLIA